MNTFKVLLFIGLALGSSSGQYMTRPVNNGFNSQPVPTPTNSGMSGFETPASGWGNKLVAAPAARPQVQQVQQVQQFFSAPVAPAAQQTSFLPAAAPCSRPHIDDSNQQQGAPSQSAFSAPSNNQQQQSFGAAPTPLQMFATQAAPVQLAAPIQNSWASQAQASPAQQFLSAAPAPAVQQSSDYSAPAAQIAPVAQQSGYSAPAAQIAPVAQQTSDYSAPAAQIAPVAQQSGYSAPAAQQVAPVAQQSADQGYGSAPAQPAQQSFSSQPIAPADSSALFNHFQSAPIENTLQVAAPCSSNGPSAADVNTAAHQIQTSLPQQQFQSAPQQSQQFQSAPQQSQQFQSAPQQSYAAPTGASAAAPAAAAAY